MGARVGETYWKRLFVFYIPLFLFVVAMIFPFYWMLIASVKPDNELYNVRNVPFIVNHPTSEHWIALLGTRSSRAGLSIRSGWPPLPRPCR